MATDRRPGPRVAGAQPRPSPEELAFAERLRTLLHLGRVGTRSSLVLAHELALG